MKVNTREAPTTEKVKGKVVPVLLTEHYAIEAYWGVEV